MDCKDKKKFKSKTGALKSVRKGGKNLKSKAGRVRAYFCNECNHFHITSNKNKEMKRVLKNRKNRKRIKQHKDG